MGDEDTIVRHDERIKNLEKSFTEQKGMWKDISDKLTILSTASLTQITVLTEKYGGHEKDISRIEQIMCWSGSVIVVTLIGIIGWLVAQHYGR
jgi:hypothetical protein